MNVNHTHYRSIWLQAIVSPSSTTEELQSFGEQKEFPEPQEVLTIIDQTSLPHVFQTLQLHTVEEVCSAIADMQVRGAGLIGAAAAFGMWVGAAACPGHTQAAFLTHLTQVGAKLMKTRPTASNLAWAVTRVMDALHAFLAKNPFQPAQAIHCIRQEAQAIADEDAEFCRRIGEHGLNIIKEIAARKPGETINILTHCNAGWLAFVDYGSALAPVYAAHAAGIPVHVWVDETRPRNQGASLTAWELGQQGVPHSVIVDNVGGHLMQHGLVDMAIVGADRVTRCGDVANKIGTYLKALAAHDNQVPFYVALPSSTFDFELCDGASIPIEERDPTEVSFISGLGVDNATHTVLLTPAGSPARNWAFDVTPARLITGLITERGVCAATEVAIQSLFPQGHAL